MTTLSPSHPNEPMSQGFTSVSAMPAVRRGLGRGTDDELSAHTRDRQRVLFVIATGLLAIATPLAVVGMLFV
jgi:hypothetical protein